MKRKKRWFLWVLAAILAALVALSIWQRNNLKALYLYLTTDKETAAQQMEDTRKEHHEKLEVEHQITVQAPDRVQSDALLNGEVSAEEVKQALGIAPTPQPTPQTPAETPDEGAEEEPEPPKKTAEELINECTAELYACKIDTMAMLSELKAQALDEWRALNKSERTKQKKIQIGLSMLDICYEREVEVDTQVRTILQKYRPLLEEIDADTSVLDTLWEYYCEEKASEKAYYMNMYL